MAVWRERRVRTADLSQDKALRGRRRCNGGSINKQRDSMSRAVRLLTAIAAIAPVIAFAQAPADTGD